MRTALLSLLLLAGCSSSSSASKYYVPPGCEACVDPNEGAKPGTACCTLGNTTSHPVNVCMASDCTPLDGGRD